MKPTIAIDNEYIERWKKEGGKVVGTVCCHIPEECCLSGSEELSVPMTGKENYG